MSDSEHSSGISNASSYNSVRISDNGAVPAVRRSSQPVPDSAPALPAQATSGLYDASESQFYAVGNSGAVQRWSASAVKWVSDNRAKLLEAALDAAPNIIQGVSTFVPGRAGTVVNAVGVGAQGLQAGHKIYQQVQQYREGGYMDGVQLATSATRIGAAALNTIGAAGNQDSAAVKMAGGAGTWLSGAATTADFMQGAARQSHQQQDYQHEMYAGLGQNPALGSNAAFGNYPPGYQGPTQSLHSTSSGSAPQSIRMQAAAYDPRAAAGPSQPHEQSPSSRHEQSSSSRRRTDRSSRRRTGR